MSDNRNDLNGSNTKAGLITLVILLAVLGSFVVYTSAARDDDKNSTQQQLEQK